MTRKNAKTEDFSRLKRRFNDWKKTGRANIRKSIEVLRRIDFLSMDEEKDWLKLYSALSRFVHTPEEFITYVEHGGDFKLKGDFVCPACTYFNEEQIVERSDCFQSVFLVLLKTVAEFHPEAFNTESGRLVISKCIEPQLREFGDRIKISGKIRKILSLVQSP